MRHILGLDIVETANTATLRIMDSSVYADFPITCETLQVQAPGFNVVAEFNVSQNFSLVLNACSLGIQTSDCGVTAGSLPDGIYQVKYSVSPNDKVYVEYAFLRTTAAMEKYYNALCDLEVGACEPSANVKESLDKLLQIKMYIDAAKAEIEYCHELTKGLDIFNYAVRQLDKLTTSTCGSSYC
jgi:hypothetical protein